MLQLDVIDKKKIYNFLLSVNPNKVLWLETPEQRQKCGRAVFDLLLNQNVEEERPGEYIHEFSTKILDLTSFGFGVGTYLIVSTLKRYAIASGHVISITKNTITLILDRLAIVIN